MSLTLKGKILPTGKTKLPNPPPGIPVLTGTGTSGRVISLFGTNGLVTGSYSQSSIFDANSIGRNAFDGYLFDNTKVNADAGSKQGSGWWVTSSGSTPQWVSINFGQSAAVNAIRSVITSGNTQFLPKNVDFQYSSDGTSWTTHESFVFAAVTDQTFNFASTIVAQYFRLYITSNQNGGGPYTILHELELLQPE